MLIILIPENESIFKGINISNIFSHVLQLFSHLFMISCISWICLPPSCGTIWDTVCYSTSRRTFCY